MKKKRIFIGKLFLIVLKYVSFASKKGHVVSCTWIKGKYCLKTYILEKKPPHSILLPIRDFRLVWYQTGYSETETIFLKSEEGKNIRQKIVTYCK